jgi:hypothetical protein
MRLSFTTALLAAALCAAPALAAQDSVPPGPRISVVTIGPGDAVWERFGHNYIWVQDPRAGVDEAYNYGMFDFQQENFFTNFARGRMMYWMAALDPYLSLQHYQGQNRAVWIQELRLTREQAGQLRDFLAMNALPRYRTYRYDYYRDNCSTRVRDALDRALGGILRRATEGTSSGTSFRWHTARLTGVSAGDLPIFTGIDAGLGPAADREISRWEEMFLPMKVRDRLAELRVAGPDGTQVPLVSATRLLPATRPAELAAPRGSWIWGYLVAGILVALAIAAMAAASVRSRAARLGFGAATALWTLFAGTGGFILLGLWLLTDHAIAYRNENLLQLSPVALPLVLLLPALGYGVRWAARPARMLALATAALAVLGFLIQGIPGIDQVNGPIIALALPINLALAWSALRLSSPGAVR